MKASFVGSKLTIARIFISFLPLFAILVPFFYCSFNEPFVKFDGFFTLFSLIDIADSLNLFNI
jgi:hypothetical protein